MNFKVGDRVLVDHLCDNKFDKKGKIIGIDEMCNYSVQVENADYSLYRRPHQIKALNYFKIKDKLGIK